MTTLQSPGMRLAAFGAILFLLSTAALLAFMPKGPAALGMLIGGMCVWFGFIWTIFSFYASGSHRSQ